MKRNEMPSSSRTVRISSRICRWMVTSSALTGSSAMMSRGFWMSAIPMETRWRCPPESSFGLRVRHSAVSRPERMAL